MAWSSVQDVHRWDRLLRTWSPAMDRLSLGGWIIVAGYFVGAVLCLRAGRILFPRIPDGPSGYLNAIRDGVGRLFRPGEESPVPMRVASLWLLMSGLHFVLALNRLLGLDELATITLRNTAIHDQWYANRWAVQLGYVVLCILVVAMVAGAAWRVGGRQARVRELRVALAATLCLLGLVGIRASSFHAADRILGLGWAGVHVGGTLEAAFVVAVVFAAGRFPRRIVWVPAGEP